MKTKPAVSFDNIEVAFAHKTDKALQETYMVFRLMQYPFLVNFGIWAARKGFKWGLPIHKPVKNILFRQFCGGETIEECATTVNQLEKYGVDAILDYALEGEKEERGFEHTHREILKTSQHAGKKGRGSFAVFKVSGIADTTLLTKVQEGKTLTTLESEKFQKAKKRVMSLFEAAHQYNVGIMVDGEESWFQDVIDEMVYEAMEKFNKETAIVYNTFQLYRKDMLRLLKDAHHDAVAKGYFLGAKLVRGAYMEKERARANEMGYPDPIQSNKAATDKDYDKALQFCINNKQRVYLISGSHNENSNLILSELVDLHGLSRSDKRVSFSQLYGMSDHISFNLAKAGFNVVKYLPYGPVKEVIPYLSRRAKENESITGHTSREFKLIQQEIRRRKNLPKLPKIA
ncbi:MAG: proline dehydrogenase family protein [Cyclobacteriaceae bacterium]